MRNIEKCKKAVGRRYSTHVKFLLFIAGLVVALTSNAYTEELVIFGNDYKIPKIYLEEQAPKGILVDILKYVETEMDCTFRIQLYPWARAYRYAEKGRGGIIGLSKTRERLALFDYSDVVYFDEVVIVVLKDKPFAYSGIKDLKGKSLGIGRGGSFGDAFESGKKSGLFSIVMDYGPVERLRNLLQGKIDAAFISPGKMALYQTIEQSAYLLENQNRFAILPKPFKKDPNYLGFLKSLGRTAFLTEFNNVIQAGYETGEINRIIDSYTRSIESK